MTAATKLCTKCDTKKPLSAFNKDASQDDGKFKYCRDCANEYVRRHYEVNRGRILEHKATFFQENKVRIKAQHRIYKIFCKARTSAKKLEALTAEDFMVMSAEQRLDIAGRLKGVVALIDGIAPAGGES